MVLLLQGTAIFDIKVRDGDTGRPRNLELEILGDEENFFQLDVRGHDAQGILSASLVKSPGTILDRELPSVLAEGGLYAFKVRAREVLEDGSGYGDEAVTDVTIVITDVNDMLPTFNRDVYRVAVPEDVGPDTPLPDLNMIVSDGDVSENAQYELVLQSQENAQGVFSVYPNKAIGR